MSGIPKLFVSKIYKDKRGKLNEILRNSSRIKYKFIIQTTSKKNVFRGLHFQRKYKQFKYIHLLKGSILDITININKKSKNYGKVYKYKLKPGYSLAIPKDYAHGYYTYGRENVLLYLMDNYRKKEYEDGISIRDKKFNFINKKKMIISKKDKNWNLFNEFKKINKIYK